MRYSIDFSVITDFFKFYTLKINDLLEIFIIMFAIYQLLKQLKDTRAWVIVKGVLVLFILYGVAYFASFNAITYMSSGLFTFLLMALVVMFQPELRKILEGLGNRNLSFEKIIKIFKKQSEQETLYNTKTIDEIIKSVNIMSKAKTGALILIERQSTLTGYASTGITINADITSQLIVNIFEKNTPLHDGAMIIRNNKISAATCYLPLSDNRRIDKKLGTRHRAAIGASEETDALIIVVSEETGAISIVIDGKIKHGIPVEKLREYLVDNQINGLQEDKQTKESKYKKTKLYLTSVILGAFLWGILTETADPVVTVKFYDIPVKIINTENLTDLGYVYEIKSGDTVDIYVEGHRSIVNTLTTEDFTATANAEEMSITNSMCINVECKKLQNEIEINTHNALTTIEVDDAITIDCIVTAQKSGKEPEGYFVSELTPNLKTITITGPKSKLKTINNAIAIVDVTNYMENFTVETTFDIYDKNGNQIDLTNCELSTTKIDVNGTVNKTKEIPININVFDSSIENSEIKINNIELSKETVIISANDEVLENMEELNILLDVSSNSTNNIKSTIKLSNYIPSNVYLADTEDLIEIEINITRYVTKDLTINPQDIEVINGGGTVENGEYILTVKFNYDDSEFITIKNIKPYVDIKGLGKGKQNVTLYFENSSKMQVISTPSIKVLVDGGM